MQLSQEKMKNLAEAFNREFGEPFMSAEYVVATQAEKDGVDTIRIKIGRREIEIDNEGNVVSAGRALSYPGIFRRRAV